MQAIKSSAVDIIVTLLIVGAVTTEAGWAWWIIVIYTPLMLLLKVLAVAGPRISKLKVSRDEPPRMLLHFLYGVNVVALGLAAWWYLFAGWLAIWILSIVQERRTR